MRIQPAARSTDHSCILPARWQRRLEAGLGAALDGVRVHRGPAAARLTSQAGGIACALGGRDILLGPVPDRLLPAILAHEAAHLVQQRRAGPKARPASAEAEAHAAAAAVLAGRRHAPRLALDPRDPACWGEAGHYYTIYFVGLAANLSDADAYNCAFWAQVADEVEELNAVPAGIAMMKEDVSSYASDRYEDVETGVSNFIRDGMAEMLRGVPNGHLMIPGRAIPRYERSQSYADWLDVQRGLHALTGRAVEEETRRRTAISQSFRPLAGEIFPFGLSLHPLGDSYAHRNTATSRMYDPPIGHGADGHTPDELGDHRRALYRSYVRKLHQVMTTTFGTGSQAILSADQTVAALDTIIPPPPSPDQLRTAVLLSGVGGYVAYRRYMRQFEADETTQIGQIRALAATRIGRAITEAYRPERFESVDFDDFSGAPRISIPLTLVRDARRLAREWA